MAVEPPASMLMEPFPFIVGAARSGTTLLRAMLDSHPQLAIPPESYFLVSLGKPLRGSRDTQAFDAAKFAACVVSHRRFVLWGLDADKVRRSIESKSPPTIAASFRHVYAMYAQAHGKPRYGDKTPWYVHHISFLSDLFVESRFIHVIRDGRDVSLSQGRGEVAGALAWRQAIRRGRAAQRMLGPTRYMEVHYEDLVAAPEDTLYQLCEYLDLPFNPAMVNYQERADEVRAGFFRPHSTAHRRLSEPPGLRPDNWRTRMTMDQLGRFEVLAGRELLDSGYELGSEGMKPSDAIVARVAASRLTAARLIRRIRGRLT